MTPVDGSQAVLNESVLSFPPRPDKIDFTNVSMLAFTPAPSGKSGVKLISVGIGTLSPETSFQKKSLNSGTAESP